jgi:DNA repair photolyase
MIEIARGSAMPSRTLYSAPPARSSFPSRYVERENDDASSATLISLSELATGPVGPPPGIARQAALAPELDYRNDVEYRELICRSLLAPVRSERMPFGYSINPYRGCEFGCVYCYARYTHEFMELEHWEDFERKIFVKRGAPEALRNDLRRLDLRGKWIAIGTATDPYQPAERRHMVTQSLLELFARREGLLLSITTKSDLIRRDIPLLQQIAVRNSLSINLTIPTPHVAVSRRTEPRACRPDKRMAAVQALSEGGIRVGVFAMPLLPRITDRLEDLDLLMRQAREVGADFLASQLLFLHASAKKRFFPWLEERFPELVPFYRRLYSYQGKEELARYTERVMGEVRMLKERHHLTSRRDTGLNGSVEGERSEKPPRLAPAGPVQPTLADW